MPPKKLTKAEKEKLKKEEAERKAAEEEAKRVQEEEERKLREEEELKAQEERARLQAIEDARFKEETALLDQWIIHQKECYEEWKAKDLKEKQWSRYLSCEKLPNPLSEKELNTYLQCWEQDEDHCKSVEATFASIRESLRLCEEIGYILDNTSATTITADHRELLQEVITRSQAIMWIKVDRITTCLLEEGNKYLDSESNLKLEHKIPKMVYRIWGNLAKNPRLKQFSFSDQDITLEIPKPLQLADVAVRLVWPPYDPLIRTQVDNDTGVPAMNDGSQTPGDRPSTAVNNTDAESEIEQTVDDSACAVERAGVSGKDNESSTVEVTKDEEDGKAPSSADNKTEDASTPVPAAEIESSQQESVPQQPSDIEDEIDMRAFTPAAGGIVLIELLRLPPQPKSVGDWTIRQVTDDGVVLQPYPVDPSAVLGSPTWAPYNLSIKLPESVITNEETKLARWDHSKKIWRTNGLDDVKIDTETGIISCLAQQFNPVAIMLDRYANMPYQTWNMKPLGINHTQLTITGAALEVKIETKENQCSLVSPNDVPALAGLLNKWTCFRDLKMMLLCAGVNVFPEDDAGTYVSIIEKDQATEEKVYIHMALASGVMAFSWSKWSTEVGEQQFVIQAAECLDIKQEKSMDLYIAGSKSCKLNMKDTDEEFSPDLADGQEPHPDLFSTLGQVLSDKGKEQLKLTNSRHIECTRELLVAVKPLTYS